jgi:hypothetical protein
MKPLPLWARAPFNRFIDENGGGPALGRRRRQSTKPDSRAAAVCERPPANTFNGPPTLPVVLGPNFVPPGCGVLANDPDDHNGQNGDDKKPIGAALMVFGSALEGLQAFTPDRSSNLMAAIYGAAGALAAALLAELYIRIFPTNRAKLAKRSLEKERP